MTSYHSEHESGVLRRLCESRDAQEAAQLKVGAIIDAQDVTQGADVINSPSHYAVMQCQCGEQNIESLDIQKAILEGDRPWAGMQAVFLSNALKYLFRLGKKDSIKQDLQKAIKYMTWLLEDIEWKEYESGKISSKDLSHPVSYYDRGYK